MQYHKSGKITDNLSVAGNEGMPAYVVTRPPYFVVDAGFSILANQYAKDIRKILDGASPGYLLLTHAHYDHIGAVSALKEHFPDILVVASRKAEQILQKPSAVQVITELNRTISGMADAFGITDKNEKDFCPFTVDIPVEEGDRIEPVSRGEKPFSPLVAEVIATPGHTRDSVSYYFPEEKMLFTGEAAGIPDATGYIFSEWLVDYDMYYASLQKLASLDVEVLCLGHNYVFTGKDAKNYLESACVRAKEFLGEIETLLEEENRNTEKVKQRIKAYEYDPKPEPKQPEPAYLMNLEARIRAVIKRMTG